MRTGWVWVIAILSAGCSFDARVPAGVRATCDLNTPCPSGFTCQLKLGRCISNDNGDHTAPQVVSATFSRRLLARGASLTLDLVVSEPLGLPPTASLAESGRTAPMTLTASVDGAQPHYTFGYDVADADVEGPASIYADLVDAAGNEASAVLIGAVTLDFTAPWATALTVIAPRSSDGGLVQIRPDEGVQVRVAMSEAIDSVGAQLTAESTDCDAGAVTYALGTNQGGLLDFTAQAPAGAPGCTYAFHLRGAVDLAGNAQSPADAVLAPPYHLDDAAPPISGLATYLANDGGWTAATTFSRQPGFDHMGVQFGLGLSAVALTTSLDEQPLASCDLSACPIGSDGGRVCTCERDVSPSDAEGTHAVLVTARDVAGNSRSTSVPVQFDFTAPTLDAASFVIPVGAIAGVAYAQPSSSIAVRATLSEAVSGAQLVVTDSSGATVATIASGASSASLDFSFSAPSSAGSYTLSLVNVVDGAGNLAGGNSTLELALTLNVDGSAPLFANALVGRPEPDGGLEVANRFSHVGGFDQLRAEIDVAGTPSLVQARLGGAVLPNCDSVAALCSGVDGGTLHCVCDYAIGANDTEGPSAITFTAVDLAGNQAVSPDNTVVLDFTAPQLISSAAAPALAKLGDDLVYTVTADEALAATPTLTVSGPGNFDLSFVSGTRYAFHRTTTSADSDGSYAVAITLTDLVGNTASALVGAPFGIDVTPPTITSVVPRASRYSAVSGFNQVLVDINVAESVDGAGSSLSATLDGNFMICSTYSATPPNYTCSYTVTGVETEGSVAIQVTARDAAGNQAFASNSTVLDFTPPTLAYAHVTLTPPSGCPLSAVSAVGLGATASVSFTVSELLAADPGVTAPQGTWRISKNDSTSSGLFYAYDLTLTSAGPTQGSLKPQVVLTDEVGNASAPLSLPALVTDTVAPSAPAVGTANAVIYQRVPWGFDENRSGTFSPKTFRLIGSPAAVDADAAWVLAFDGADPATAAEIGSSAAVDGGFGTMALNRADRPEVFVASYDAACNHSAAVKVRDVSWTATLGFKVPGSTLENPHLVTSVPVFAESLQQDPVSATEATATQVQELTAVDGQAMLSAAQASWAQRATSSLSPPSRTNFAMAYDATRGKLVVFGGLASNGYVQDTWEWDLASGTWADRTPAGVSPPADQGFSLAFDDARGKVVLFIQGQTWEWDGAAGTWTNRTPATGSPPARSFAALTYDSARGKVVLFGGAGLHDTWEWDGAAGTWTERTPASGSPPGRDFPALAYDSAREKVVLFGGAVNYSDVQDTWEWDGATGTWTERTPGGTSPDPRERHTLAYDSARGKVVLFAGSNNGINDLDDTWEWDGAAGTWTNVTSSSANPPSRSGQGMAYATALGKVMVFGGSSRQDLWAWDGASAAWSERTPSAAGPSARYAMAMAYDEARNKVVLFSGSGQQDTWEWDAASGTWSDRSSPGPNPAARMYAAMAYDRARGTMLLFGGVDSSWNYPQDTWEWDGWSGTWSDRTPAGGSPPARWNFAMAYDSAAQQVLLFGGAGSDWSDLGDTWAWDGASGSWSALSPAGPSPAARKGHALASDTARGKVVLFGGLQYSTNTYFNDTWEWDGSLHTWTEVTPASGSPPARYNHALAYDSARQKTLLFAGGTGNLFQDSWEWDGASGTWTDRTPTGSSPPPRTLPGLSYAGDGRVVAFGGVGSSGSLADTWEWNGGSTSYSAQTLAVALDATGATSSWTVSSVSVVARAGGTGHPSGALSLGADLLVWDEGSWKVVATNADDASAPNALEWSTQDAAMISRLLLSPNLNLAVRPASPSGAGPGTVAMDYVEVTVRYRLP